MEGIQTYPNAVPSRKILNNLLNKSKLPRIPPLFIADKFVTKERAVLFNTFFVAQCQAFRNTSVLPNLYFLTSAKPDSCVITNEQILNILISLNANNAHGPDDISINMINLCINNSDL